MDRQFAKRRVPGVGRRQVALRRTGGKGRMPRVWGSGKAQGAGQGDDDDGQLRYERPRGRRRRVRRADRGPRSGRPRLPSHARGRPASRRRPAPSRHCGSRQGFACRRTSRLRPDRRRACREAGGRRCLFRSGAVPTPRDRPAAAPRTRFRPARPRRCPAAWRPRPRRVEDPTDASGRGAWRPSCRMSRVAPAHTMSVFGRAAMASRSSAKRCSKRMPVTLSMPRRAATSARSDRRRKAV